ncbi:MAG: class I SAM-dependent methyltransferase [Phycisphaerales bacterium]|nr:class I SAM-dependent methyltransferase [Phycisphaerales bacterium]
MSRSRKNQKKADKKKKAGWRTAATSDRHELYELSVQSVDAECEFIEQVWSERRRRPARLIREDFCGTGAASVEWVRRHKDNRAIGVDLDPEVLAWGKARAATRATEAQLERMTWRKADVTKAKADGVDTVLAMNFSYFIFRTRPELRRYFRAVHKALVADGMFLLDAYGGSESFAEVEEERDLDGFTYIWDQHIYHPVTGYVENHIHFRFPDGTRMDRAFSYHWRLWTLPEIQELLLEAGFRNVTVYWEGTEEDSEEGNGEFEPNETGEACEGWIAYLVAEK